MRLLEEYDKEYLKKLEYLRYVLSQLSKDVVITGKCGEAANNLITRTFTFVEKKEDDVEVLRPFVENVIKTFLEENLKIVQNKIEKYGSS